MKVFGGTFDGRNRVIVAAKTKKAAHAAIAQFLHLSYYGFDMYGGETWNETELKVALESPGTVFSSLDREMCFRRLTR